MTSRGFPLSDKQGYEVGHLIVVVIVSVVVVVEIKPNKHWQPSQTPHFLWGIQVFPNIGVPPNHQF